MRKWLIEFEEKPISEFNGAFQEEDYIQSPEEMLAFINAWIADDPQRAKWLKADSAVLVEE